MQLKMVGLIKECYEALEALKKELQEKKKMAGQPKKTTFSECICTLLRETGRIK
jgi:hypothetical protein